MNDTGWLPGAQGTLIRCRDRQSFIVYQHPETGDFVCGYYKGRVRVGGRKLVARDFGPAAAEVDAIIGKAPPPKTPEVKTPDDTQYEFVPGNCLRCGAEAPVIGLIGWCDPCLRMPRPVARFTPNSWDQPIAVSVDARASAAAGSRARSVPSGARRASGGSASAARTTTRTDAARGTAPTPRTPRGSNGKR